MGGHCLPIDPLYLAWQTRAHLGYPFRLAELANEINMARPKEVVTRAGQCSTPEQSLNGAQILILGVAYKPDVGDIRERPCPHRPPAGQPGQGHRRGPARHFWAKTRSSHRGHASALESFDLAIVVTDHGEFDMEKVATLSQVLDCRNSMKVNGKVAAL